MLIIVQDMIRQNKKKSEKEIPPSEEQLTESEDESEIPNVLPQQITKTTPTKSNHELSSWPVENANNQNTEDQPQEDVHVIPVEPV